MFNCKIEFNNTSGNINFPCTNNVLYAKFAEMRVPDELKAKIDIHIVEIDYEPLKSLEGKSHDPDAVNLLAQKLDSLTENEIRKFKAAMELNGITNIYDMINLTENMHYYTLIRDMSDIKAVGKLHIMTRNGGIAAGEVDNIDFETIGKRLLESGNGRITKYGNIYTNSDLEYYEPCSRESLPQFQYYDRMPVCVEMSYQGNINYVYLPDTPMALERAAYRMGAYDVSQCKIKIDHIDFEVSEQNDCNSVPYDSEKLKSILDEICKNEGIEKLNETVIHLNRLDKELIPNIVPIIEYSEDEFEECNSDVVIKLADIAESFIVYGDVTDYIDLGKADINKNPDYCLHVDIEDYFNYERYGYDLDEELYGVFLDEGIYVALKDDINLSKIFDEENEVQGIQMN